MAIFPATVATATDLLVAVNDYVTNLREAMTVGATTMKVTVGDGAAAVVGMTLVVGTEAVKVTAKATDDFTVTRAFNGTTATAHASGAEVKDVPIALHHNGPVDEVVALENYLRGTGAGDLTVADNLRFKSGTAFVGTFDHGISGSDKTWTMPNATGTVPLLELAQTWTAKQTFRGAVDTNIFAMDLGASTTVFNVSSATAAAPNEHMTFSYYTRLTEGRVRNEFWDRPLETAGGRRALSIEIHGNDGASPREVTFYTDNGVSYTTTKMFTWNWGGDWDGVFRFKTAPRVLHEDGFFESNRATSQSGFRAITTGANTDSSIQIQNDARTWLLQVEGVSDDRFRIVDSTAGTTPFRIAPATGSGALVINADRTLEWAALSGNLGKFTHSITAARTWTFPDASMIVGGSASALTSGRVVFATTGGLLLDDADFTFDGSRLSLLVTGATGGLLLGGDAALYRGAADRLDVATGDSLRLVNGGFHIGNGSFYYTLTGAPTADRALTLPDVAGGVVIQQLGNLDITDTPAAGEVLQATSATQASWVPAGGGGLGLALNTEAFVTIGNSGNLTAERALTAGTGVTITDGGANSTVTVAVNQAFAPTWTGQHTWQATSPKLILDGITSTTGDMEINWISGTPRQLSFDPKVDNATDAIRAQFFRFTNTSGGRDFILYAGNNTSTTRLIVDVANDKFTDFPDMGVALTFDLDATHDIGTAAKGVRTIYVGTSIDMTAANIVTDTTTGMQIATGSTQKLGVYGATPIVRQSLTALTDNSGGTANDTLESIGVVYSQTEVRNNFADLAAKVNAMRTVLVNYGWLG